MPVTQNITFSATPPTTGENPTTFNYNAIGCWDDLKNNIVPALNTAFGQLNELETNVNAKEVSAVAAAFAAVAAANFQGTWTGQLTEVGQSWEYSGIIYAVIIAGTASPATTPSNWYALNVRPELVLSNSGFTATLQSGTLSGNVVHTLPSVSSDLAPTASPSFTGTPTVNGVSFSGYSGFKNYIINGGFDVWHRGTSGVSNGSFVGPDMWRVWASAATTNWSQATSADFGIYAPNIRFGLKWYGDPASAESSIEHRIESKNSINLSNKYVTVSFIAKSSVAQTVSIEVFKPNAEDNYTTAATMISSSNISVTTTATKFSVTFLLDDVKNGLSLIVRPSVKNQSMYIAQVQLEEGSVATPFEQRPYGLELSLCQRYLPSANAYASGQAYSATLAGITFPFKVQARINPTGIIASGTFSLTTAGGGSTAATSPVLTSTSTTSGAINFTSSSLTAGNGTVYFSSGGNILFTGCEL